LRKRLHRLWTAHLPQDFTPPWADTWAVKPLVWIGFVQAIGTIVSLAATEITNPRHRKWLTNSSRPRLALCGRLRNTGIACRLPDMKYNDTTVAAAIARVFDDTEQGLAIARAIRGLPGQVWIPLDETLAEEAIQLAAQCRVRGADAVYGAVARRYGATLVTWDQQQLKRLRPTLPTLTPAEALSRLREQHRRTH